MHQKEGKNVHQYMAHLKEAADLCNFMVSSAANTVSYVDQRVLGRLVTGLKDKQITREILQEVATKEPQTGKLQLCHIKRLAQVKDQAKEEAAQLLNMENNVELNWVGSRPPGKAKVKSQTAGRDHPYVKGGGTTGDKPCGSCARQHGKEAQCPATGITCFNCEKIGHLKAACRRPVAATSASTTEIDSVVASLNYIGQVSGKATVVYNPHKHRARKSQQCELRVKPEEKKSPTWSSATAS